MYYGVLDDSSVSSISSLLTTHLSLSMASNLILFSSSSFYKRLLLFFSHHLFLPLQLSYLLSSCSANCTLYLYIYIKRNSNCFVNSLVKCTLWKYGLTVMGWLTIETWIGGICVKLVLFFKCM